MSKLTASAAGAAMPAEGRKSRRALLRLFGAAPALAILPAGSALALASPASPAHADAALFAMGPAIEAADRELDAALDALDAAEHAYSDKALDKPAPLEADFTAEERQAIDALRAAAATRTPSPALAAYEQAVQDHERETERLKAERGVTAAHEMEDAAHETISQVQANLVDTPVKTLAGLIFKARYAATHYRTEYDEEVMASIVDDCWRWRRTGPAPDLGHSLARRLPRRPPRVRRRAFPSGERKQRRPAAEVTPAAVLFAPPRLIEKPHRRRR